MTRYTATIMDVETGAIVWAVGYGMYIEADTMQAAREEARRQFEEPMEDNSDPYAREFYANITAMQAKPFETSYLVVARRSYATG